MFGKQVREEKIRLNFWKTRQDEDFTPNTIAIDGKPLGLAFLLAHCKFCTPNHRWG
jgi:hypothetical protein